MSQSLPFYVVNAFSADPFRGGPAAVVYTDNLDDSELLHNIAINFAQPMTAFLRAIPDHEANPNSATFDVRWFTTGGELPLCGHATIASSGLMFATPELLHSKKATINYRTREGAVLTARKVGDWVDLSLNAAGLQPLSLAETERLTAVVGRAFGKRVTVRHATVGLGAFSKYLLVEIDPMDDLAGCKPQTDVFLETGYCINIITSASSEPDVAFVYRMFAPEVKVSEDPACGSANCLLAPYWSRKLDMGDSEMFGKQVSSRSGVLKAKWHESEGLITLSGQTRVTMKGILGL